MLYVIIMFRSLRGTFGVARKDLQGGMGLKDMWNWNNETEGNWQESKSWR